MAILGPTASGKTAIGVEVAKRLGAEIISIDSMQVYRGMDIGTAKPNLLERGGVVHHMIDVAEPSDAFSVADFRQMGQELLSQRSEDATVIVGGSGLHFRALVDPLTFAPTDAATRSELEESDPSELISELERADPDSGLHVALDNPRRVIRAVEILRLTGGSPSKRAATEEAQMVRRFESEIEFRAVGIDAGENLEERVRRRLLTMRKGGLVDEVKGLRQDLGRTAGAAVGYREILELLDGKISVEEAFTAIEGNTRKLARRQRTWFHRDPRIQWIPWSEKAVDMAARVIEVVS